MGYFGIYLYSDKVVTQETLDNLQRLLKGLFGEVLNTTDRDTDYFFDIYYREQIKEFIDDKHDSDISTKHSYVFQIVNIPEELKTKISDERDRDAMLTKYEYMVRDRLKEFGFQEMFGIQLVSAPHGLHSEEAVYLIALYIPKSHHGGGHINNYYHKYRKYQAKYKNLVNDWS